MAYLIRFISRNAAGGSEHHDRRIETSRITIGRSTDQVLHLKDRRARLEHAVIEPGDNGARITSSAIAGVTVNGKSQRDANLTVGDVIEVGANIIRVIEPPTGYEFAISFELSEEAAEEQLMSSWSTPTTGLGGFGKRKLSWALAAIVIVFGFAIPKLIGETFLQAGPLHSVHQGTSGDCKSCHVTAFERVPDAACIDCHTVNRHTAPPQSAVLGETRCASCHLEHNEPAQLINQHQGLCADCHADVPASAALPNAADFLDDHPGFQVALQRPTGNDPVDWHIERFELAAPGLEDLSNLKFDHRVHLDPDGIVTPDGNRVLACAECHTPDPGGARMQPIAMDQHCSGCHTLAFDADDPSRTVPHGDANAVVQTLVEYYSARLLGADPDEVGQRLRRPGQALTRADRDRAAAEARTKALEIAEDLFERRACVTCHTVTQTDGEVPWHVQPVRLTQVFFPHANFSHAAHATEVSSCDGCHNASQSDAATDVLIPDIDSCRSCHGSGDARRNASTQVPSTCVMCHSFHAEAREPYP